MLKRLLSLVLAALIAVPAPALPAQAAPPSIERPVAHAAGDAAPALPRLAQRLSDTIPPLYMLGGDDKIAPVALWNAATDAFPSTVLTHSSASLATMFDSTGKLTYAPNNLLTYSNDWTNAAWAKSNVTTSSGVADPFGGTAATTLTATGSADIYQGKTAQAGVIYVSSFWVRRRTGTGQISLVKPDGLTVVPITVTSSWTQYSTFGVGAASAYANIRIATSGDAIDVYGATLSAVTYETTPRTGDQVITTSAAYYGPRIDYDPNTLAVKGLQIEEARTNIVLQNRDLTNAVWTKGATATVAKDQTGIDGVANSASSFTGGAISATNTVLQSITLASSTRAQSAWVKRLVGSGVVNMTTDGGTTWNAITLTAGWTQVQFSQAAVTNPNVGFQIITNGDKIAVDFVQNETGTFATSVLQTAASSVTRAADVVQFTGAALTALQGSAASLITEWTSGVSPSTSNAYIFSAVGGAGLRIWTTNSYRLTNGTNTIDATLPSGNVQQVQRTGFAYSGAGRAVVASGGTVTSDANGAAMSGAIYFGSSGGSAAFINEHIKSFAIYSQRLSDATLQAKSVVGASYAANDNANPFAPQFAANDNLPVHWRIAL